MDGKRTAGDAKMDARPLRPQVFPQFNLKGIYEALRIRSNLQSASHEGSERTRTNAELGANRGRDAGSVQQSEATEYDGRARHPRDAYGQARLRGACPPPLLSP